MMMPLSTQHDHEKTLVMIMIIMLVYIMLVYKHDECGGDLRIGNRGPMGSVNEDEPLSIRS
jgi:hypothetical protein